MEPGKHRQKDLVFVTHLLFGVFFLCFVFCLFTFSYKPSNTVMTDNLRSYDIHTSKSYLYLPVNQEDSFKRKYRSPVVALKSRLLVWTSEDPGQESK